MVTESLRAEALRWRERFYRGQRNWSSLHHIASFGSVLSSLGAGALVQAQRAPYAIFFTTLAAALAALAAAGGFQRKWQTNRLSRSRVDCLLIDLQTDTSEVNRLADELKKIIARHDREIIDAETHTKDFEIDESTNLSIK